MTKEQDKIIEEARIEAGGIDWNKFPNFKKAIQLAIQQTKAKLREDIEKWFNNKNTGFDRDEENNLTINYYDIEELLKSLEDEK